MEQICGYKQETAVAQQELRAINADTIQQEPIIKQEFIIEPGCSVTQADVHSKTPSEMKIAGMSRNYYCIDCKCTTRNPRLYLQHRRDFHKESISIYECDLCVYASKHSQKLARHLRTVHRDIVEHLGSNSGLGMNSSTEIISDGSQTAKNSRLSTCKICGLIAVNKTILLDHVRNEHPDMKIYQCDHCDYSHYIRDRYNRHHRYHSMSHIRCQECEFQTIYRWNLERHMRHHTDTISWGFRCKKCNFTASTKQSITAHEIAHHSGLNSQIDTLQLIVAQQKAAMLKNEEKIGNDLSEPMEHDDEFDASAFLSVVMEKDSNLSSEIEVSADDSVASNANQTKYFCCKNCNFRNEINWNDCDVKDATVNCTPTKTERNVPSSQYRCGFCHQISNWKHVIERHCRLVHNMPPFIEKYSPENRLFQNFESNKRRFDSSGALNLSIKTPNDGNLVTSRGSFSNIIAFPRIFD